MKPLYTLFLLVVLSSAATAQSKFMIHSISFSGNEAFSDADLRAIMLTRESGSGFSRFLYKLGHIIGDSARYLDPIVLRADLFRLKYFYKDNGFPFVSVDSSLDYDNADDIVDVHVMINEGPASYVHSIGLHGIRDSSENFSELLNEKPALKIGLRYSASSVVGEANRILGLLQNDGYAYAKRDSLVVSPVRVDSDSVQVKVDLYFSAGRRYLWGDLSVISLDSGNVSYERHVVLREMLFKGGDVYSYTADSLSEQRLYELNLFELAKIVIPNKPPPTDTLPVVISLRSRPTHEITPELLISDENNAFNYGGGLGYLHRNFLGDARLLSLNASIQLESFSLVTFSSKALQDTVTVGRIEATAEMIQPYLFSNATSLTWDVLVPGR